MKETLQKDNLLIKPAKVGDIIQGKVIAKKRGTLFLDLGAVGAGIIFGKEFYQVKDVIENLKIGDNVFVKIIDLENEEGYFELSISQADKTLGWKELAEKKEKGEVFPVKILKANKGGLLTEVSGIPGFLPVSQLSAVNYPKVQKGETSKILKELQKFIGKELMVQVFDLDPKTGKFILSEKSKETEKIKENLKKYKTGDVVEGEIVGVVDFGAFFKFGKENLEGLIHISELDWKIIENPSEIVKVGDKVKAKIIEISNGKVYLSLKAMEKDPWEDIGKTHKKGDIIKGKVVKFNPFGAFVQISPKIQGLCHISEFGLISEMKEKLKIGQEYDFQILEIKPKEHRLNLRLVKEEISQETAEV